MKHVLQKGSGVVMETHGGRMWFRWKMQLQRRKQHLRISARSNCKH